MAHIRRADGDSIKINEKWLAGAAAFGIN